jgi:hypothetical protein
MSEPRLVVDTRQPNVIAGTTYGRGESLTIMMRNANSPDSPALPVTFDGAVVGNELIVHSVYIGRDQGGRAPVSIEGPGNPDGSWSLRIPLSGVRVPEGYRVPDSFSASITTFAADPRIAELATRAFENLAQAAANGIAQGMGAPASLPHSPRTPRPLIPG